MRRFVAICVLDDLMCYQKLRECMYQMTLILISYNDYIYHNAYKLYVL